MPAPSPLRTVHDSFPSYGSSPSKASLYIKETQSFCYLGWLCFFPLVGNNPSYCKKFRIKRVSQKPLERFRQPKFFFSNGLCDTHLQLLHLSSNLLPINGFSVEFLVGRRMDFIENPHLLFFLKKFYRLSRNEAPDGYLHPCGSGDVSQMIESQPVSTPLQDSIRFFRHLPPYPQQYALRLTCPKGEGMRFQRSAYSTTDTLGPLYLPVGILPVSDGMQRPEPPTYLWSKPNSSFGLSSITAVTSVHLC